MSEINCNNCAISDFKESLCKRCDKMKRIGSADDIEKLIIGCLPSAPPERWIPCSERLPKLDEDVLATTAWNDITIAWRIGISEWFIHEGNTIAETADVLAWMPLPEQYKGEQE